MHLREDIITQSWHSTTPDEIEWRDGFFKMAADPTFENAINIYHMFRQRHSEQQTWSNTFYAWVINPTQELKTYIKLQEV
jgi:hypothetical protein